MLSSENIDRKDYLASGLNMEQASTILPSHGGLPYKDQCVFSSAPTCGKSNTINI